MSRMRDGDLTGNSFLVNFQSPAEAGVGIREMDNCSVSWGEQKDIFSINYSYMRRTK